MLLPGRIAGFQQLADQGGRQFGRRVTVEYGDLVTGGRQAGRLLPLPVAVGPHVVPGAQRYVLRPVLGPGEVEGNGDGPLRPTLLGEGRRHQPGALVVGERVGVVTVAVGGGRLGPAGAGVRVGDGHHQPFALGQGDPEQVDVLAVERLEPAGDASEHHSARDRRRPRAMALRWISTVPAGIRRFRATRNSFSSGDPSRRPVAPWTWTARSATRKKASSLTTLMRLTSRGRSGWA